jgi:UDP-N-acetylglucosamine/UDP-N-acetylgalactosamine diphosphorylase
MGGGTSRKNHSEVGSSYIHFNYTPNQDKATPSLIGDVPKGVMLNQLPIFLGGQGGMVGPVRISYGTVIAAGIVCRKDILAEGRLLLGQDPPQPYKDVASPSIDFHPGIYWHVKRQVVNNLHFIANLVALRHWYVNVRTMFVQDEPLAQDLHKGAIQKVDMVIEERTKRFRGLAEKMPESINRMQSLLKKQTNQRLIAQKQEFFDRWQDLENLWEKNIDDGADNADLEAFLMALQKRQKESSSDYITAIRGLHEKASQQGTKWLQSIVDTMNHEALEMLPSFRNG